MSCSQIEECYYEGQEVEETEASRGPTLKRNGKEKNKEGGDKLVCNKFTPKGPWNPKNLLVSPLQHRSRRPKTNRDANADAEKIVKDAGNVNEVLKLYSELGEVEKKIIAQSAFADFLVALRGCVLQSQVHALQNKVHVRGLTERFWDTTNTFHFPWGEIALTPLDFAVLCGLSFAGSELPFDKDFHMLDAKLSRMFGPISKKFINASILQSTISEAVRNPLRGTSPMQRARLFLFYLLSATIFSDHDGRARLLYVPALEDLSGSCNYNWGAAAYAAFMLHLRAFSRSTSQVPSDTGFWRILELWFYEYFPKMAPCLERPNDCSYPMMARWASSQHDKREICCLEDLRKELNKTCPEDVNWNPWANLELPKHIAVSRTYTSSRVICDGPCGWVWYLGERVSRQSLQTLTPATPLDPPVSMFWDGSLAEAHLVRFKDPIPAVEFIDFERSYEYVKSRLMGPLIVVASTNYQPLLLDLRVMVPNTSGGQEVLEIESVPDLEIEGWPLPEGCPGLNCEESKMALRWGTSWKRAFINLKKDFTTLLRYMHCPPSEIYGPRGPPFEFQQVAQTPSIRVRPPRIPVTHQPRTTTSCSLPSHPSTPETLANHCASHAPSSSTRAPEASRSHRSNCSSRLIQPPTNFPLSSCFHHGEASLSQGLPPFFDHHFNHPGVSNYLFQQHPYVGSMPPGMYDPYTTFNNGRPYINLPFSAEGCNPRGHNYGGYEGGSGNFNSNGAGASPTHARWDFPDANVNDA